MTENKRLCDEFLPCKVVIKDTSIRCLECGGAMMRLAYDPTRKETFLTCERGECGHYTIVDDIYLSTIDWWEQYPRSRSEYYHIGDVTTRSIREVFSILEETLHIKLDERFKRRVLAAGPHLKIYVAGCYSDPDENKVMQNIFAAIDAGIQVMRKGHEVFVPHAMTYMMDTRAKSTGFSITYDEWTQLDDTFLRDWADALLLISNSPGADHELEKAIKLGKKVYRSLDEIPNVD